MKRIENILMFHKLEAATSFEIYLLVKLLLDYMIIKNLCSYDSQGNQKYKIILTKQLNFLYCWSPS